jgi:hypothetical protein
MRGQAELGEFHAVFGVKEMMHGQESDDDDIGERLRGTCDDN